MTNFQDPQPQSRRAARQGERSGTAEAEVGVFPASAEQSATDDMWDTTSRRAAQLPPVAPAAPAESLAPASPTSGRRSAGATPSQPAPVEPTAPSGEPLDYVTQQRAPQPAAPETRRSRSAGSAPLDEGLAPTQALPKVDQPQYRVRDYSPEGRRAEFPTPPAPVQSAPSQPAPVEQPTVQPAVQPPVQQQPVLPVAAPPAPAPRAADWTQPYTPEQVSDLDYQTQARVAPASPTDRPGRALGAPA